jgi:hypothetical protein
MEQYSVERWLLDRHQEMADAAATRARLEGWQPGVRFAERVAAQLHRLADRLEGRRESHVPSPMFRRLDI